MRVERLKCFLDLYEQRNFTRAAKLNFMSQTALTQYIGSLEAEFDVRLFDRSTFPVQPTAAGDLFYREAQVLLRHYWRMQEAIENLKRSPDIPVRIFYTSQIDLQILGGFVEKFRNGHPEIPLRFSRISFRQAAAAIATGSCDVAIGIDFPPGFAEETGSCVLYRGEYCALVGPRHPLYGKTEITKEELYRQPMIMLSQEVIGASFRKMQENCRADGYQPDIQRVVDDEETEFFCIEKDNLLGFVPDLYDLGRYTGVLKKLRIRENRHLLELTAVYAEHNSSVQLLMSELKRQLKTE